MNVIDAAQQMGLSYPGGIEALAMRMGKNPTVLRSKLNPNCTTHGLMLEEAVHMQAITGRCDIVMAMASDLGGIYVAQDAGADTGLSAQNAVAALNEVRRWLRTLDGLEVDSISLQDAKAIEGLLIDVSARLQSSLSQITRHTPR